MSEPYTYNYVAPSATPPFKKTVRFTRGEFAGWTPPTGIAKVPYAVFRNCRSELLIPIYDLTTETKKRLPPAQSPEETGVYQCECGNTTDFTGIDEHGYGGPEVCECEATECTCLTTLTQDFTIIQTYDDQMPDIQCGAFVGGGCDSEIGHYTLINCRQCGKMIWKGVE